IARARDAHGDLTPVRDQQAVEQRGWHQPMLGYHTHDGAANRLGRIVARSGAGSLHERGSGRSHSSFTATDAIVMPNTDGTNAIEPSTRCLCSQSFLPFIPPGHTQRNAPSSYASS